MVKSLKPLTVNNVLILYIGHFEVRDEMKNNTLFFYVSFVLFLFTLIVITGCEEKGQTVEYHSHSKVSSIINQKELPSTSFFSVFSLPISIPKGDFSKAIGWLSNNEIIYLTQFSEGANLYIHDLISGQSEILFESPYPIITSLISPDKSKILIHASPSTYEGEITIIDRDGEVAYSENFASVEMVFEWNHTLPEQLFITAFKEDWSFTNYYLDLVSKELSPVDVRKPFAKWTGKNKLAFLDWSEEDISLLSPLIQKEFDKAEFQLTKDVFQFDTFFEQILTISVDSVERLAKYTFYSEKMVEKMNFKVPVLSSYSGWLIPYYELSSNHQNFITMVPLESAEADTYRAGYQLESINLSSGEKKLIMENMDNVPFTCSPNQEYCLIGYQLEKLLHLGNKTILPLF
jgi:hypothetical protein